VKRRARSARAAATSVVESLLADDRRRPSCLEGPRSTSRSRHVSEWRAVEMIAGMGGTSLRVTRALPSGPRHRGSWYSTSTACLDGERRPSIVTVDRHPSNVSQADAPAPSAFGGRQRSWRRIGNCVNRVSSLMGGSVDRPTPGPPRAQGRADEPGTGSARPRTRFKAGRACCSCASGVRGRGTVGGGARRWVSPAVGIAGSGEAERVAGAGGSVGSPATETPRTVSMTDWDKGPSDGDAETMRSVSRRISATRSSSCRSTSRGSGMGAPLRCQ
jgi:hypothetical protein